MSWPRRILVLAGVLCIGAGIVLWALLGQESLIPAAAAAGLALLALLGAVLLRPHELPGVVDPDDVRELDVARRRELMRGTSLFLREMQYRYSVRLDARDAAERLYFTADVNTIRLGFIPSIITDNASDRQGLGYVAFVYDGRRWRGPGLPCPPDQEAAVRHAGRCVSPLATDEETQFDG